MLSFQEKLDICSSFPELQRKDVSLGRVNYYYKDSAYDKKTVVYHLHPNGNGYVYAGLIQGASTDEKGFVNIREIGADELRSLIEGSIRSLAFRKQGTGPAPSPKAGRNSKLKEQEWQGPKGQSLLLKYEDELWYIYAGQNLDAAFETRVEAEDYLKEEGFSPKPQQP